MPSILIPNGDSRLKICYDTFGSPAAPPLLLFAGLGTQMIESWDDALCDQLSAAGYWVIRFDNRDSRRESEVVSRYTLREMANDGLLLVESLLGSEEPVHVAGMSMGGMIATIFAGNFPRRTRTLVSICSSTKAAFPPLEDLIKHPEAVITLISLLLAPPPDSKSEFVDRRVKIAQALNNSSTLPIDPVRISQIAGRAFDIGICANGARRQFGAAQRSPIPRDLLRRIDVKTLIIHGDLDPLVPLDAAKEFADLIPGASLSNIDGMGHYMPVAIWPQLVEAIAAHAQ